MASAPPMFSGPGPQTGRLPVPGNPAAPIVEGLGSISQAVDRAQASGEATDDRVRETGLQVAHIERQRQLQLRAGDVATYLATSKGQLDEDLVGLRQQAAPGAEGHLDAVNQRIAKFRDDAFTYIGNDPELTSRFSDNVASTAADARTGEVKWTATQSAEKSALAGDVLQTTLQGNIRSAVANGTASDRMLTDADALDARYIEAQPLPGNVKDKWRLERHQERLVTAVEAATDVDPHAVLQNIDAGKFSELDDKQVAALRERARVAADRLDNKAKEAVNEGVAVQRAQDGNLIEDVNNGTHVDPTALQGAYARAAASNKPEDIRQAHDLKIAMARNATTVQYDLSSQQERTAALHEIEGRKGWQADEQLNAAHTQLQTLISRDAQAADHDAVSLYARQTSQTLPNLNLGDPATMRQRFLIADRAAQRFGKPLPTPFTDAEATDLRQQYNQADVGGKALLIQGLGAYGPARARQMMAQIAPGKPELLRLAELGASPDPAVRSTVREASDGSQVQLKDGVAAAVRNSLNATNGDALARLPSDHRRAIEQVATWIYAHRAAAAGKAAVFDPNLAQQAIGAALGGSDGKGGFGKRNGAQFVLPSGVSEDDFSRVLAIGAGHPDIVRQAANGVPKWVDGKDMHQRQFLDLVPVLTYDDGQMAAYAFRSRGGSGYVKNERGQDYLIDVRKLATGLRSTLPAGH